MPSSFAHLHFHTQYSIQEGAIHIKDLGKKLEEKDIFSCAITDHGNLFGAIEFYNAMKKAEKHPVIGQGFWLVKNLKEFSPSDNPAQDSPPIHSLNLLCRDNRGYQNLILLSSLGYTQGKIGDLPCIDYELLKNHSEGLIALSGGLEGPIEEALKAENNSEALEILNFFREYFRNRFYFEISRVGFPNEDRLNRLSIEFAEREKIPLVATNPCFYPNSKDAYGAHILKLMGEKKKVEDHPEPQTDELYIRSTEEMRELFADLPEAFENAIKIAKTCQISLENEIYYLPNFPTDEGLNLEQQIVRDAKAGLQKRFDAWRRLELYSEEELEQMLPEYLERLDFELSIINSMNYSGYFLIVADFIHWAEKNGAIVGPGRGSGAGSIVAYSLGITKIDPIRYGLLFERFLNPERISMPDFDIDFDTKNRDRVVDYVRQKYGRDKVCLISTFGSLKSRGVLRGVGRVLNFPQSDMNRIVGYIPKKGVSDASLEEALDEEPMLKQMLEEGSDSEKRLLEIALQLEGLKSTISSHAAGVLIMNKPITEVLPVCTSSGGEGIQSQFTMEYTEQQGAVKFDFLGLANLSIIEETLKLIHEKNPEFSFNADEIEPNHPKVFSLLCKALTTGVFQLESPGIKKVLKRLQPDCFEDIIALLALYRPGPLGANMVEDYIDRKKGKEFEFVHEKTEPVLRETFGVPVYQEQVMRLAQDLAGFSLGEADILRRAMGKKKRDLLQQQEEKFTEGCTKNGIAEEKTKQIFGWIEQFSGYGFNKSHSAAYALITYQTAYLKSLYPVEFMTAILNIQSQDKAKPEDRQKALAEAREMKIKVLPPDIQKSEYPFTIENGKIRFGLGGVKNLNRETADTILEMRKNSGGFQSLEHFYLQPECAKLQVKSFETLVQSGALDSLCPDRRYLLETCAEKIQEIRSSEEHMIRDNFTLFGDEEPFEDQPEEAPQDMEKPAPELDLLEKEKELLGAYLSAHPMDIHGKKFQTSKTLAHVKAMEQITPDEKSFRPKISRVMAYITNLSIQLNDKNLRQAYITLEDKTSSLELFIRADLFAEVEDFIENTKFVYVDVKSSFYNGRMYHNVESIRGIFAEMIERANYIRIRLNQPTEKLSETIESIGDFLKDYPGNLPVVLETLTTQNEKLEVITGIRVKLSEGFFQRIESLVPLHDIECPQY